MQGNVAEWVLDGHQYDKQALDAALQKTMKLSSLDAVAWPTELRNRMALGGSFHDSVGDCQIDSSRFSSDALYEDEPMFPPSPHWTCSDDGQGIGFRIVRPFDHEISQQRAKRYWEPDHPRLVEILRIYQESGYSSKGIVDDQLPQAIEELKQRERKPRR